MIAFTIEFGMDKLASDRIYCDVATADRYLRINTGNTTRRNIIGSYVRILCDNIWKILCWCKNIGRKICESLNKNSSDRVMERKR